MNEGEAKYKAIFSKACSKTHTKGFLKKEGTTQERGETGKTFIDVTSTATFRQSRVHKLNS